MSEFMVFQGINFLSINPVAPQEAKTDSKSERFVPRIGLLPINFRQDKKVASVLFFA